MSFVLFQHYITEVFKVINNSNERNKTMNNKSAADVIAADAIHTLELNWDKLTPAQKMRVAVYNAKQLKLPGHDRNYFEETLAQRYPCVQRAGSYFEKSFYNPDNEIVGDETKLLEKCLFDKQLDAWKPYSHENVGAGCEAFRLDSDKTLGTLGIIDLEKDLFDMSDMVWQRDHADNLMMVYHQRWGRGGIMTKFAVAIIGMEGDKHVLFTVHPGDPIRPSCLRVAEYPDLPGKTPTMEQYRKQMVRYAKIVWF